MDDREAGKPIDKAQTEQTARGPRSIIVVFTHNVHLFGYMDDLEGRVYCIDDERLYDAEGLLEKAGGFDPYSRIVMNLFGDALISGKPIIEIPFNPAIATIFEILLSAMEDDGALRSLALAFFHNDRETETLTGISSEDALERKAVVIDAMLHYPYIKMEEIPCGAMLAENYLLDLVRKYRY